MLALLRRPTLVSFVVLLGVPQLAAAQNERMPELEVLRTVARLFEGMRTADSAMVRTTFAPGARFARVDMRQSPAAITYDTPDAWLAGVASSAKRWDERVHDVQVRVDAEMAQVWAPYTFYLDGTIRHCGVDAMELLRDASGWKITHLADTQRRDGCREVPAFTTTGPRPAEQPYFEFQVEQSVTILPGSPVPVYPAELKAARVEGEVLAQFVVGTDGRARPGTLKILKSSHALFTDAVRNALPQMQFSVASIGGKKVAQLVQHPFVFALSR
jgi:Periplasmic protein TonB, links inner and outer membranes